MLVKQSIKKNIDKIDNYYCETYKHIHVNNNN